MATILRVQRCARPRLRNFVQIMASTTVNVAVSSTTDLAVLSIPSSKSTSNPTLIFLSFWGGSPLTFRHLYPLLSEYPILSPWYRGWGKSTGPPVASEYSIGDLASDTLSVIQHLSPSSYILVGHSMGGKVAQLIASGHPSGLVGLVLLAPAPPTPLILPTEEMRTQQVNAYFTPESAEFVVRNVLTSSPISDEDVGAMVNDCRSGTELATAAWPKYAAAEDISEVVEEIDVPILVLAGELDKVEPVERVMGEVLSRLQGARFFVIKAAGHMLPIEAPERLAEEISGFIGSLVS